MAYSPKKPKPQWLGSLLLAVVMLSHGWHLATAQSASTMDLRYLSYVMRDMPPTVSEAKAFANGETSLEQLIDSWLASDEHSTRIHRWFNDMLGLKKDFIAVPQNFMLFDDGSGILHNRTRGTCNEASASNVTAWWLEPGQTIKVCSNVVNDSSTFVIQNGNTTIRCGTLGPNGFDNAVCGCGPNMILCFPQSSLTTLRDDMRFEFARRALDAYHNERGWDDLLAGDYFHGSRLLYWMYLHTQTLIKSTMPTEADLNTLAALPLSSTSTAAFPSGNERAGVATAPGFLRQYNSMRSRIRGLTMAFLCQDIDARLNTDNIASFLNDDLDANDLAHAENPDCAACHYPMDNMASTMLSWNTFGYTMPFRTVSQLGHVFGETGEGPSFLMKGYVERAPQFHECMAKRAFEDFSGHAWDELSSSQQQDFLSAAQSGPRPLVRTVLSSPLLRIFRDAQAIAQAGGTTTEAAPKPTYAEVEPILIEACGGGSCHASGSYYPIFIGNETNTLAFAASIKDRIQRTGAGQMPPMSSGKTLTSEQIALINRFLE